MIFKLISTAAAGGKDHGKSDITTEYEVTKMTELEKMLAEKIYDPADRTLIRRRETAHDLSLRYNQCREADPERKKIIKELLPDAGENVYIQGPIQFDYGCFTKIGKNTFINFNFTCLDCCPVDIGKDVFFGPNVSILTPVHPLCYQDRNIYRRDDGTNTDREYAKPITIKDNCWIAGNVTICGGVTIGEGTVIGAGSVVTKDIPGGVVAAGVPCRVIRKITEEDSLENHPELF